MLLVRLFLAALALQIVGCLSGYYLSRNLRTVLTEEDFLVENLSALLFLVGGLYGCWCLWWCSQHRWTLLLITTLGFVGFLDEISFGQRWLNFTVPVIAGVEVDGVHDLVRIPLRPLRQWLKASPSGVFWVAAITSVVASLLLAIAVRYRRTLGTGLKAVMTRPVSAAWLVFAVLLASAMLLDERIIRLDVLAVLEELLEMNAALALILVAYLTARSPRRSGP